MEPQGRRDGPSLASLDFLGSGPELQDRAEQLLREAGGNIQPGDCSGTDQTGAISVVVDAQRVVQTVTIAREWRRKVGVVGFADALFDAYRAAIRNALELAALLMLQEERNTPSVPVQRPPAEAEGTTDAATAPEVDDYRWLRATWETLNGIDAELDRLTRAPEPVDERTLSSPNGHLKLGMRGGSIVSVTGDADLIAGSDAGQLQYEARILFRTALSGTHDTDSEVNTWTS